MNNIQYIVPFDTKLEFYVGDIINGHIVPYEVINNLKNRKPVILIRRPDYFAYLICSDFSKKCYLQIRIKGSIIPYDGIYEIISMIPNDLTIMNKESELKLGNFYINVNGNIYVFNTTTDKCGYVRRRTVIPTIQCLTGYTTIIDDDFNTCHLYQYNY